jgi:PKD repeat protein
VVQNTCGSDTICKSVTTDTIPLANFTKSLNPTNGCVPVTATFTNATTRATNKSYSWSVSPASGWSFQSGSSSTSTNPVIIFSTAGTYIVTLTASNSCGSTTHKDTIQARSKPGVTISSISNGCSPLTVNPSASFNANNSTITAYSWTMTGGSPSSSTSATPGPIIYASAGTYKIVVSATNACGTTKDSTTFTVNASPGKSAAADKTICKGDSVNIGSTAVSGHSYSWTSTPSGFTGSSSNPKVSPSATTTYYLTETITATGCTTKDTVVVTVNSLPTVDAGSDEIICIDKPLYSLTGFSPGGGTWSGTGVSSSGTFTPSTAGSGTKTLTYTYTDPVTGCKNTDTKTISVNALPTVTTKAKDTFCNSSTTVTFTGTPSGGTWKGNGVTSGGVFTPSTAGNGTHNIYYVYTSPSTGCKDSALKQVKVVSPATANAGPDDTVCVNDAAFSLTGYSPSSGGTWSGTGVSSSGTFSPSTAGVGTHTLTYSYGTGTCLVTDTKVIKVNGLPTVDAGSDEIICIDKAAYSLTGFSPSGGTWSGTGVSSGGTFTPSTAGSGTKTLTYSYTDPTTGCTNTDTKTITVNVLPTVTTKAKDTFCNSSTTVTFTGTPSGGTWKGNGVISGGVFTPSTAGNGTHNIYYVYTSPSTGCKDSALKQVTVVSPSSIDAGANDTVCISASAFSLTGFSPAGGTWSGTGVSSGGTFTPSAAGVGTHTLTYSFGTGTCLVTDTKIVKVNPLPTVDAGSNETICIDKPAYSMTGHSPSGGTWSGTGISSSGTFTPSTAGAGTHTLTYSYTDPTTHCTNTDTKTIKVNSLPTVTTKAKDTFCNSSTTVTFTGSPGGGTWKGNGVTSAGVFTPSTAGNGTHNLYYVYTDPTTGCKDSALKQVTVVTPSSVDAGQNDTVCISASAFSLTGYSPSSGGSWSGTGVTSSGTFTPAAAGVGVHTLTYSYGMGTCLVTDTKIVKVNALPTVDAGSNETICIDRGAYGMTGHSPSGGTWSGTGVSSSGTFTPSTAGAGTHTITYTYTDPTTHCTNSDTKTIKVNALPTVTTKAKDTFCNTSTTVTFTGSPSGGVWKGSGVTTAGVFTPSSAGVGTHNIYYVFTDAGTGCKDSAKKEVTVVNPSTVDAGANDTVCVSDAAFSLTGYTPSSGGTWSGTAVTSSGTFTPATAGAGTFTLTYSYGTGTCLVTDTKIIKVNALPTVYAGSDEIVCVDKPAYTVTGQSPSGGTWSGTGISSAGTFTPSTAGSGTYTLTYTYTDPTTHCKNTDTKTIKVNALPTVTTKAQDTFCNTSTTVTFTGTPSGGIWKGTGVTSSGVFTPSSAGVGTHNIYYVYADAGTGCKDSAKKEVTVVSPSTIDAGKNDTVCVSDAAFSLTGYVPGSGGTWSGTAVTSTGTFTPATAGAGTFTLTYSYGTGTCKVTDTKIVKVNALPTVDAGSDEIICIDKPAYGMTGQSPSGGIWSGTGISSSGTFTPSTAGSGTHTLTYTYTDPTTHCKNSDTKTIKVNALPTVTTKAQDTFCNTSTTVTFTGTPSGGVWHGKGVTLSGTFTPSSAGVGTHNVYYVYTDGGTGCRDSAKKTVEVVAPVSIDAGQNDTVCVSDADYNLTGYTPASGGTWSGTGVTAAGKFSPSTGAGTYTLTYTYGTGTCKVTDTKIVKVNALPTVDAGSNEVICIDKPAYSMTGQSPSGGTWSGTGISASGTFTPCTAGAGTHTLTYTYKDPTTKCTNTDTKTIKVNALPVVTTKAQDTFCNTSITVTFSGSPAGGIWKGKGVSSGGIFTPSSAGVGTHILYYVYTESSTGCRDSAKKTVEVVNPAAIDAGKNDTVCVSDGDYNLTGYVPASGGTWSGAGVTGAGKFSPSTGVGTYTLTYTYGTGTCKVTDTKIVRVNPLPTVDAGGPYAYCLNEPVAAFSGHSPTGGIWTGNGIVSSANGTFSPASAGVGVHKIVYRVTDPVTKCINRDTLIVEVYPLPKFSILSDSFNCKNSPAAFRGNASGSYSYFWTFGDGNTATGKSVTHAYANTGWYDIILVATDSNGCHDTSYKKIRIAEPPTAKFSRTPFSGPGPLTVGFANQSFGEIDTYAWDFGDGQKSTLKSPPDITFRQSDNGDTVYFVKHTVTNCCGSTVWMDSVKVFPLPKARFGTDRNEGCSPLKIKFSNKSVGKPDTYFWDFGNGKTSTLKDPPPQIYTTDSLIKKYRIILVATNKYGVDTATWEITVYPKNVTSFFNPNPQTGCAPATFTFTDYSKGGTFISWSFGDGDSSFDQNPVHTYQKEGTYTVKQFVNNGCSYDTVEFDIQVFPAAIVKWFARPACASDSVQFLNLSQNIAGGVWNFGDGDTSTLLNPKHKYKNPGKYVVSLTGKTITHGCLATYSDTAYAMPLPVSSFKVDPVQGCKPLKVQFTNTGTDSVFYIWSFGDGNTSIDENPVHTFNDSGIYLITQRTINKLGCWNEFKSFIKVHPYPISKFTIPPVPYCGGPQMITFGNNSIGAAQYEWSFSNGKTSTVTTPTITFDSTGTYTVTLIATNEYGCKDTSQQEFTIHVPPKADFAVAVKACAMDSVQFINQSKLGLQFEWDFGDGSKSNEENPKHQYKASGQYTVTLKITGAGGCRDSITKTNIITINPKPVAGLTFTVDANPFTGWTRFIGAPGGMSWYIWDFGDDRKDSGADLEHIDHRYDLPGNYKVRLIIVNKFGCTDTIEVSPGIEYFDGLFVPNALSPESGGDEERIFLPKGANLAEYRLEIYNTWGELLWWTEKLDRGRPSEPFIGEDMKGRKLPQGAYVWKISATFANGLKWQGKDYNGNKKPMGTVTLIR